MFSFTNCYGYGFMMIFFLNLGFYYNDVEYRHKYHNRQHISIRKNPCFIVYMTASPAETSSVTSGWRVSVQPAKPALPISSCMKSYQKYMCFLHIRCLRLFVFLFLIEYPISRSWLCLRSMCSVHC